VGRRGGPRPPAWGAAALVVRRWGARPGRTGCPRVHAAPKPRSTIGVTSTSLGVTGARRGARGGRRGRWRSRSPARPSGRPVAVDATMPPARKPARAMTPGVPVPGDRGSGGWGGGRPCARSAPHPGRWGGGGPIVGWLVHRVPPSFPISVQRPAIVTGVLLPPLSTEDMDGVALSSRGTLATTLGSRSPAPACGGRLHDPRDGLQADAARVRAA
jgi:hypothetical protein